MAIYTAEIQGHNGSGIETFYLADQGYNTSPTDTPPNTHFRPTLKVPASFEQSVGVSGEAEIGFGQIVIVNADGRYDEWRNISFEGRPCIVKVLEDRFSSYGDAPASIYGVIEDIDISDAYTLIRVRLYDRLLDLDKPLLTSRFGGTTLSTGPTADGDEDLAGTIRARIYGEQPNFEAELANRFDLIYHLSDKPLVSAAAYDGGIELDFAGNHASLAALQAATIAPYEYATALSTGTGSYARLGSQPLLFLTWDCVAGATSADRSPAAIAKQMLLDFGVDTGAIDNASFAALHTAAPGVSGIRITDDMTAKTAIETVLKSVTGWCLPDALGKYAVGRIEAPKVSADAEFAEWQLRGQVQSLDPQDGKGGVPIQRVIARYRYLGRSHTADELETDITADRKAYLLGPNVYREVVAEDEEVAEQYLRAGELIIETRFIYKVDAEAEANRVLAIRKVKRRRWQVSVEEIYGRNLHLMETVKLTMSRFMPSGQNFIVLRRLKEFVANRMTFDVWG